MLARLDSVPILVLDLAVIVGGIKIPVFRGIFARLVTCKPNSLICEFLRSRGVEIKSATLITER